MDRLLEEAGDRGWLDQWGRSAVKRALEDALEELRARLGEAGEEGHPSPGEEGPAARILRETRRRLERAGTRSLRPVLNGTGVVLHTNLGRAPLAEEAARAVYELARGYANLEMELETGERGSRQDHCRYLLDDLVGSESSLVVNNNAAAVALAVHALAGGGEVLVSRGEMVEIGGSFRIPEVIRGTGAVPVEVGTTNRTRREDYRRSLGPETGAILKVHPSNYRIHGFTESVPLEDLVDLGREHGLPVIHDLGSGLLRPDLLTGFPPEPGPAASVAAGADAVTWSGDKLLGGPQAGIINGRAAAVERMEEDPLHRAVRVDKMTVTALEVTLRIYRDRSEPEAALPSLRALLASREELRARAEETAPRDLPGSARVEVVSTDAVVGGGAYPGHPIPSAGWEVRGVPGQELARACRMGHPPLVGTVREGRFRVDFRTLLLREEAAASGALRAAIGRMGGNAADGADGYEEANEDGGQG